MTRWDTDNLNAAHTARELQQEFDCNLVDQLREVNGGKLAYTNTSNAIRLNAADRIEQLERKLVQKMQENGLAEESYCNLEKQLDAEKALADQLAAQLQGWWDCADTFPWRDDKDRKALAAYRKARGL